MNPHVILCIIVSYLALLLSISYLAGRKADSAGFYLGNRNSNWLLVAISTIGAAMSGVTYVSVPGMVATSGWAYMQMVMGFTVGQLIIAYVLIPLYYKHNLTSIYQYLQERFGLRTYKSGAWLFFISKILGASVRLFIVCSVLQLLVFDALELPFWMNAIATVMVVYLCTFRGGVKSLIWIDVLKTCCMVLSVVMCIYVILRLGVKLEGWSSDAMTRVFFWDNPKEGTYFWKQFLAGIFLVVAMTGLDQDLMQRSISCKNIAESQKNVVIGACMQIVVIMMFLLLGYLLYSYAEQSGIRLVDARNMELKGDDVFPYLATSGHLPVAIGVLFIVGFIAAAYSVACGSITALTTSFTIDILNKAHHGENTRIRHIVHILMAGLMAACVLAIHRLSNTSVIDTVYKLASYTYGPLLGMFAFGILTKQSIRDRWIPLVLIGAPLITWVIDKHAALWWDGYTFYHERLILNALLTFVGMICLVKNKNK